MSKKKKEGKDFLSIGTWVKFSKRVVASKTGYPSNRDFTVIKCLADALSAAQAFVGGFPETTHHGQIVGGKYLRRGVTDGGTGYDESLYFTSTGPSLFVYLVRVGFTNRPIWVMPEDVEETEAQEMPYMYQHFSEDARKNLSLAMKQEHEIGMLPRDDKGRFTTVG